MVAKDEHSGGGQPASPRRRGRRLDTSSAAGGTLGRWQIWLSRAWYGTADQVTLVADAAASGAEEASQSARALAAGKAAPLRRRAIVVAGLAALVFGAVAAPFIARASGVDWGEAGAGVASVVWALVRLTLLEIQRRGAVADDAAGVRGAWALGLLPWVLALTPELRFAAWLVSAVVTLLGLRRLGTAPGDALTMIAWAWGAQAAAVALGTVARSLLILTV